MTTYKLSAADAGDHLELPEIEGHYGELGEFTIGFETYRQDFDPAPLFVGLPGDNCQARHWGVVLEGALIYNLANGDSVRIEAGEAYYVPAGGHRPVFTKGTRVVEFSVTTELADTMRVVERNLAAMGSD